jgi:hypothetical protein
MTVLPVAVVLALYRASFFYGVSRWVMWIVWAHVFNDYQFDIAWGGPGWVTATTGGTSARIGTMPFGCACAGACCGGPRF